MADATDILDRGDLAADFGSAYGVGLILANPELLVLAYRSQGWANAHIDPRTGKAVRGQKPEDEQGGEWDANRTAIEITQSQWYQSRDGMQRQAENARLSDPASWSRNVDDITATLLAQATKMGAVLTGDEARKLADSILRDNWDYIQRAPDGSIPESVLNAHLVPLIAAKPDGSFGGQAGMNATSIRQLADAYGVRMTDKWYLDTVQALQSGRLTEVDVRNQLVANSRSTWSAMGDSISETTTVKDLASSYIQTMASVLEIDPDMVDLETPEIRQALTFIDPGTGKPRQKTVWEFEQGLRKDPRWDRTQQGQKELSDAGMQMLRDFGFWK
ncbi:MAG: hypothetical protein ACYCZR_10700 [Burkholderiales bacterium]